MRSFTREISVLTLAFFARPASSFAASSEAKGGLPQFNFETFPGQLLWLAVIFIALYVFFSRIILPKLSNSIETRHNKITGDLERAEALQEEAAEIRTLYEDALHDARKTIQEKYDQTQEKMRQKTAKTMQDFQMRAQNDLSTKERAITKATEKAKKDIEGKINELAELAGAQITGDAAEKRKAA